ncbi:AAA family ATPase [Streptomyces sp. SP18CS02]|uniref:AAA family ATPase n=1 Tax=Streptomyces sp. SP18CS02 TaxID=3002531 RepID=UPI002E768B45|nr:AAA family ATPase [Streptomyces sp. SP18CS02]MEE1757476.1 AAA family ATPase [Streptomyces sp. SP18CS02]
MERMTVDREPAAGVVLLSGIPGSGKSTVAAALAARLPAAAHIEVDGLQDLIVSGGRLPTLAHDAEADRQIFLRARNACLLADSFVSAGFLPVIDDVVVRRSHLAFYRETLGSKPLHVVFLAPGPRVAWQRNLARAKTLTTDWAPLDEAMRTELAGDGVWIDNAQRTVAGTVDAILGGTGLPAGPAMPTTRA